MNSLVIGNGESRRALDLTTILESYVTVGCNAIQRDYSVDHIVCCDRRMVEEAIVSKNTKDTMIYVREDWLNYFKKIKKDNRIQKVPDLPYSEERKIDNPIHWGSGPYAVLVGATLSDDVTLIGFDLYPFDDKINNVYKGTKHYGHKTSKPIDYSYWVYQIAKVFQHYPDTKFKVVNTNDWDFPKSWKQQNVFFETLDKFNG